MFEIFETFPNEAGRVAHLAGRGAMLPIKRSNALHAQPAVISRLYVLASKPG